MPEGRAETILLLLNGLLQLALAFASPWLALQIHERAHAWVLKRSDIRYHRTLKTTYVLSPQKFFRLPWTTRLWYTLAGPTANVAVGGTLASLLWSLQWFAGLSWTGLFLHVMGVSVFMVFNLLWGVGSLVPLGDSDGRKTLRLLTGEGSNPFSEDELGAVRHATKAIRAAMVTEELEASERSSRLASRSP